MIKVEKGGSRQWLTGANRFPLRGAGDDVMIPQLGPPFGMVVRGIHARRGLGPVACRTRRPNEASADRSASAFARCVSSKTINCIAC